MYHSENEKIYHSNFAWYVERCSSVDINPESYHLTASELINQLLYINFLSFECRTLFSSVARYQSKVISFNSFRTYKSATLH